MTHFLYMCPGVESGPGIWFPSCLGRKDIAMAGLGLKFRTKPRECSGRSQAHLCEGNALVEAGNLWQGGGGGDSNSVPASKAKGTLTLSGLA